MIATPLLLDRIGPHVAFGVPGGLMLLATWVFWLGRWKFIHVPPDGKRFIAEATSREGLSALGRLAVIYVFVAMFWALFDQTGSSWVLQAQDMDRVVFGVEVLESQIQSINPLLVMLLVPFFLFVVYPLARRFTTVTPLRKIGAGFVVMIFTFLLTARIQVWIDRGDTPSIGWQLLAYVILTASEVLVSVTCLEFSYTQAPKALKSLVMALFLMSVSIGNLFTSAVNFLIQTPDGGSVLEGPAYYLFFAAAMALTTVVYIPVASRFPVRSYIQEEEPEEEAIAEAIGAGGG
jgi:POT family proton-dependent oligopeptide transporter